MGSRSAESGGAAEASRAEGGGTSGTLPGRILLLLRERDPGLLALKRSVRVAVVLPGVLAIATAVSTSIQVRLFAAFGAFALLIFVDLGGSLAGRLRGYLTLAATAVPLMAIGTLCSTRPLTAVAVMAAVGFIVIFAGAVSPLAVLGSMYLLLAFVLPVSVPVPAGEIPHRLGGWAVAVAVGLPSLLLVWPRPWHDSRRRVLARAASSLADLARAHAGGGRDHAASATASSALRELRDSFDAKPYNPTGAGPEEIALARMTSLAEWVRALSEVDRAEAAGLGPEHVRVIYRRVAGALGAAAGLIGGGRGGGGPGRGRHRSHVSETVLVGALSRLRAARESSLRSAVDGFMAETVGGSGAGSGRGADRAGGQPSVREFVYPAFRARALAVAAGTFGSLALEASGAAPPSLDGEGDSVVLPSRRRAVATVVRAHLNVRSVWFRNSLRGAAGLALAVAVAKATGVSHGFWVVFGTLSVLRSNALGTDATAVRAVAGTVIGFVIAAAVMLGLGAHTAALWPVLPLATFAAGFVPAVVSFTAGQAGFTVMVVVLFNILSPAGWSVGLVRVEDVALGCAVSIVVSLLLWPRGAAAQLGRALCDSYSAGAAFLTAAVERLATPGLATPGLATFDGCQRAAAAAYHRMDDAYRQFLAERGAKVVSVRTVSDLVSGAVRLQLAAGSLGSLPVRPASPGGQNGSAGADLAAAAGGLEAACREAEVWYLKFAGVLSGDPGPAAPVPAVADRHVELRRQITRVFEAARDSGDEPGARLALRLLWAGEDLTAEMAAQRELAGSAAAFAQQCRARHFI